MVNLIITEDEFKLILKALDWLGLVHYERLATIPLIEKLKREATKLG